MRDGLGGVVGSDVGSITNEQNAMMITTTMATDQCSASLLDIIYDHKSSFLGRSGLIPIEAMAAEVP